MGRNQNTFIVDLVSLRVRGIDEDQSKERAVRGPGAAHGDPRETAWFAWHAACFVGDTMNDLHRLDAHAHPPLDPILDAWIASLREDVVERDRRGGTPKAARDRLRETGLLLTTLPRSVGGAGRPSSIVLDQTRRIARVDPSLAHVVGFHHLLLETIRLFGDAAQYDDAAARTVRERLFWGNALNPKDPRARFHAEGSGGRIDGTKSFCSGSGDADALVVSAIDDASGRLIVAAIPADRAGLVRRDDWDGFGQRQTDSGTVEFEGVRVEAHELLTTPGPLGSVAASLRPCFAQAILGHVLLGLAEGALEAATSPVVRPRGNDEERALLARRRAGEFLLLVEAAKALARQAATALDAAFDRGDALTPEERGEVARAIALAKVAATRAALEVAEGSIELLGARASSRELGLDRFWRNARTLTLHDPVDLKLVELGRAALDGTLPTPSFYS